MTVIAHQSKQKKKEETNKKNAWETNKKNACSFTCIYAVPNNTTSTISCCSNNEINPVSFQKPAIQHQLKLLKLQVTLA